MTATTSSRPGSFGSTARAIGALVALGAMVFAPPVGLVLAVGNPLPEHVTFAGSLTDDAIIGLLAAVVWAAWIQLVVVVAIEGVAAVRGGALPRALPGCGFQQHLARRLVVTASLLLAGTASLSTAMTPASAATTVASAAHTPLEGRLLTLDVPAAAPCVAAVAAATDALPASLETGVTHHKAEVWYEVAPPRGQHHDSLWDIAERHLGDGLRWREIYDLNRHREQPDGQRLEQPRLIQPGWQLLMPSDATGLRSPRAEHPRLPEAAPRDEVQASTERSPGNLPTETPQSVPHPRLAGPVGAPTRVATPSIPLDTVPTWDDTGSPAATTPAAARTTETGVGDDEPAVNFAGLTLGLGAVSAAGLLAELARRRRRAQRLRRPGERLARPSERAASAERFLRTGNAELTVTELRDALRELAAECRAAGRSLPDVEMVRLNAERATLHLRVDAPDAVPPFMAEDPRTWILEDRPVDSRAGSVADAASDDVDEAVDPYPALVALGVTDDAVLLVNLEAAGSLAILGDPGQTAPILHALIAELGTSALTSTAQLAVAGCPRQLVRMLDHGRVTVLEAGQATGWARARTDGVATVLAAAGIPTVHGARGAGRASDLWSPAVLLSGPGADPVTTPEPHSGLAVVALDGEPVPTARWTLSQAETATWRLEPHGINLVPQQLDVRTLDAVSDLLTTADAPPEKVTKTPPETQTGSTAAEPDDHTAGRANESREQATSSGAADAGGGIPPEPRHAIPMQTRAVEQIATDAPRVLVLGPVEIHGASDELAPGRLRRATELVTYLALHRGATQHQLDEALSPGRRVSRNTRNSMVSRARQWLGTDADGKPYFGLVADEGGYDLSPAVTCDWDDFQVLVTRGIAEADGGVDDLIAALQLVRGRPFLGVNPAAYGWAEVDTQDMISAIVDAAHALAELALADGDHRRARWAAAKGLDAEPFAELLFQDAIRAAHAAGDTADAQRLLELLRRRLAELDPEDDMMVETGALGIGSGRD